MNCKGLSTDAKKLIMFVALPALVFVPDEHSL